MQREEAQRADRHEAPQGLDRRELRGRRAGAEARSVRAAEGRETIDVRTYDPTAPGRLDVGTRTEQLVDRARGDRAIPIAVWYPRAKGLRSLVLFSHSSGGHRMQAASLCAHLASHGYVVAAPDHTGSTAQDVAARAARPEPRTETDTAALIADWVGARVPDLSFLIGQMLRRGIDPEFGLVETDRIGLVGWSFGGWAVLAAPETDRRVRAVVAMAPAGSERPLPGIIPAKLTFAWGRDVPTLFMAADRDRAIPLDRVAELYERARGTKHLVVMRDADHGHFGDEIAEQPGLVTAEEAQRFVRAHALAHLDAYLRDSKPAREFLEEHRGHV